MAAQSPANDRRWHTLFAGVGTRDTEARSMTMNRTTYSGCCIGAVDCDEDNSQSRSKHYAG